MAAEKRQAMVNDANALHKLPDCHFCGAVHTKSLGSPSAPLASYSEPDGYGSPKPIGDAVAFPNRNSCRRPAINLTFGINILETGIEPPRVNGAILKRRKGAPDQVYTLPLVRNLGVQKRR